MSKVVSDDGLDLIYRNARTHTVWRDEPVDDAHARAGAMQAFGRPLRALPHLDRAAVIVAVDADPLGPGPDQIRMGRGFSSRRMVRNDDVRFARLYALEPVMTMALAWGWCSRVGRAAASESG